MVIHITTMITITDMTLNISKFRTYVKESGASILENTNEWELLRFSSKNGVGIVYTNKHGQMTLSGAADLALSFYLRGKKWNAGLKYYAYQRPETVEKLLERDGSMCFYCSNPLGEDITVEHILSVVHGGCSNAANLCLTHAECNRRAGSLTVVDKIKLFFK